MMRIYLFIIKNFNYLEYKYIFETTFYICQVKHGDLVVLGLFS